MTLPIYTVLAGVTMSALAGIAATPAQTQQRPAVVELFTSEGCSSCPPAEVYLGELAQRPDVLALAFHVDYWDSLGWRDRFVIPEATPRQRGYARTLRLSSMYTPQVVIDGTGDFVGSDRAKIVNSLQSSRSGPPMQIVEDGETITIAIDVAAMSNARGDVTLISFERSAVSSIGRGENAGRTLREYNIVRSVRQLGRYDGNEQKYHVSLSELPKEATNVAVIIQAPDQGTIVGAASVPLRASSHD